MKLTSQKSVQLANFIFLVLNGVFDLIVHAVLIISDFAREELATHFYALFQFGWELAQNLKIRSELLNIRLMNSNDSFNVCRIMFVVGLRSNDFVEDHIHFERREYEVEAEKCGQDLLVGDFALKEMENAGSMRKIVLHHHLWLEVHRRKSCSIRSVCSAFSTDRKFPDRSRTPSSSTLLARCAFLPSAPSRSLGCR